MDTPSSQVGFSVKQNSTRRSQSVLHELWSATKEASVSYVDAALFNLKRSNVDSKNTFGLTALHIAVWRNHVPIVRRLLAAGADPNIRDGESGWSSLHRAFHFGHLAVAGVLIEAGASLSLEDSKGRTPIDLLSGPVQQILLGHGNKAVASTELFSWGNGANYNLGTGDARIQKAPCKVDAVQGFSIKDVSAAKFHSVAVTASGELYTWGFGRGGRLGHPDFDIHSGQAAVITPRQVISGLGKRQIKVVAAAKHHTIAATIAGDVYTWGTNREGQLGYTSVDTQPTPRRVTSLKSRIIAVAAANKHSAVVTEYGEVLTWGCNREGQLGYGTCNSASNYVPRVVESLKGKFLVTVSAAKQHTIALGSDGEVYSWGYKTVTPRRVVIQRNTKKYGNLPLKFHLTEKLHVVKIAAGWTHSTAVSDDGSLFYWVSSDPNLHCQQLYSAAAANVVTISASKFCTSFVTSTGDVYTWDGKDHNSRNNPVLQRVHGIKQATSISVGNNHFLAISSVYNPKYVTKEDAQIDNQEHFEETDSIENDDLVNDSKNLSLERKSTSNKVERVPGLKDMCQKVAAEYLLEPKNAVHLLDIAEMLEADDLRMHCQDFVLHNLAYILTISPMALANASIETLCKLEKSLDAKSSESWSYRCLPTRTATFPVVIDSEETNSHNETPRSRNSASSEIFDEISEKRKTADSFLCQTSVADQARAKQVRAIRKKLQQIEMLESRQRSGLCLDEQQKAKLSKKLSLLNVLSYLESGLEIHHNGGVTSNLPGENWKLGNGSGYKKKGRKKGKKSGPNERIDRDMDISHNKTSSHVDFQLQEDCISMKDSNDDKHSVYEGDGGTVTSITTFFPHLQAQKENNNASGSKKVELSTEYCLEEHKENQTSKKSVKKKSKKGGLSVFLSGALDDASKAATPPPPPPPRSVKQEVPAWGGVRVKESLSLLEIQSEQIVQTNGLLTPESKKVALKQSPIFKISNSDPTRHFNGPEFDEHESDCVRVPLSQFVRTSVPIAITPKKEATSSDAEISTPPWSHTPPSASRSSLRDIQRQQVKERQNVPGSLKNKGTVDPFVVGSKELSKDNSSRWYKPEIGNASSIRSIQIEEKAMKDLRRLYKNVKLVQRES